ncbi:Hypothetical protein AJAP_28020 [Amycolatopsis japonica]|uniref:Secreted protein n=1 Tax=Amycolatopsis japonica TaxID=208439 RepID=A0A075UZN7_9PSEU|nr:Hypothetical protein AJAP_28020 [Amycolatopsis japonica]
MGRDAAVSAFLACCLVALVFCTLGWANATPDAPAYHVVPTAPRCASLDLSTVD